MSKRSVTYTKPSEPPFLKELKQRAGYEEGPTLATKRQQPDLEDLSDGDDEQPAVVVLREGDLSAEEARALRDREAAAPADLSSRIVFKAPDGKAPKRPADSEGRGPKKIKAKSLLSFDEEENDDC